MKKLFLPIAVTISILFTACNSNLVDENSLVLDTTPAIEASSIPPTTKIPEAPNEMIEITAAAAASLTDVTKELTTEFYKKNPNVTIVFTYGSSGALQTQIEEGAPVDIFMPASNKQMIELKEKNMIAENTDKELLINELVLIVPNDSTLNINSFEDCATDKIKMIAFGDPKTTPAGQYAEELFTNLNIWDKVSEKTNFASDVRQVLSWIEASEADCGIVFKTDAMISDKVKVVAAPPKEFNRPAIYPVGIVSSTKQMETAQVFEDFLFSDEAKVIFEKFGFDLAVKR